MCSGGRLEGAHARKEPIVALDDVHVVLVALPAVDAEHSARVPRGREPVGGEHVARDRVADNETEGGGGGGGGGFLDLVGWHDGRGRGDRRGGGRCVRRGGGRDGLCSDIELGVLGRERHLTVGEIEERSGELSGRRRRKAAGRQQKAMKHSGRRWKQGGGKAAGRRREAAEGGGKAAGRSAPGHRRAARGT